MLELKQINPLLFIFLGLAVVGGAFLRIDNMTVRTISHNEIYVPGIDLPYGISAPRPRLTVWHTLSSLLVEQEPHPPGYYLVMLGWTKLVGTSILALRLPSVIMGIASILLIYLVGMLEKHRVPAIISAGLLALNGYQILWSQIAKMYIMGSFLGLLGTVLFLMSYGVGRKRIYFMLLYLVTSLIGLTTIIWYWPILLTQMVWEFSRSVGAKVMSGMLRVQLLVVILGSPLISLAIYQSRRPSYLGHDPLELLNVLIRYLQFGILFEPDPFGSLSIEIPSFVLILVAILGLFLLVRGILSSKNQEGYDSQANGPSTTLMLLATIVAFLSILVFAAVTTVVWDPDNDQRWSVLTLATSLLPWFIFFIHLLLQRNWSKLHNRSWGFIKLISQYSLSSFQATFPIIVLILISPIIPLVASRGFLLYSPYLLLTISLGIVTMAKITRLWIPVALILIIIFPISVINYKTGHHEDPTDYKSLVDQWKAEIEPDDQIFVRRYDPVTSPIFYYLEPDRYNFVASEYANAIQTHTDSRIWFLYAKGHEMPPEMEEALKDYRILDTIDAFRLQAVLYGQ